jgi:hypothetical protein
MLENKIGHKKTKIKSHNIRVFLDAEYDPGIKPGGLSITEQRDI